MANLSTILGTAQEGGAGVVLDPLPTFGVWTNYAGNQYTYTIHDSYTSLIGGGYYDTSSEQWNNYLAGWGRTDSNIGANNRTTFWAQGTPACQSEGHWLINLPAKGGTYAAVARPTWLTDNFWPFYGTVIGPEGIRQRISLFSSGESVQIHSRGGGNFITAISPSSLGLMDTTSQPGASNSGMISYNQRTGRLAWLRGNTSNNYRLHVWDNPNINLNTTDLNDSDLYTFMLQARNGVNGASYFYNDFTWNTTGSTSTTEAQFHMRLIAGDNGYIGMVRMSPSNQTVHGYVIPNPNGTSLTSGPINVATLGLTTSYGIEQGNPYGMRSTMTWDNRVVACYSPYYYYGSGINMHYVDTTDPSKGLTYQDASTSWGRQVFPLGKGDILIRHTDYNADGAAGFFVVVTNPSGAFTNYLNAGNTDSAITSGSGLGATSTYLAVDTSYTSTNYPIAVPMPDWTRTG